jgi:hypothetical protein
MTPIIFTPTVKTLLEEFTDVFPDDLPRGLPLQRSHDIKIELQPDASPIKKGLYRLSGELKKQLHDLLEKGFIQPSTSLLGAPILLVNKENGGFRLCVDYRALNNVTIKNSYPRPRIYDIFDQLTSAKFFTKIDLRSSSHQIRLDKDTIPETALRTRYRHFEFTFLSFGLSHARPHSWPHERRLPYAPG